MLKFLTRHYVFFSLLLLVGAIAGYSFLYADQYVSRWMGAKLTGYINQHPSNRYACKIGELEVSLWKASIDLNEIHIYPKDSLKWHHQSRGNYVFDKIRVEGWAWWELFTQKKIYVESLTVQGAKCIFFLEDSLKVKGLTGEKALWEEYLKAISIGQLAIHGFNGACYQAQHEEELLYQVDSMYAEIQGVHREIQGNNEEVRYEQMYVKLNRFTANSLPDHHLEVKNIEVNSQKRTLTMEDLLLQPRLGKKAFNRQLIRQKDWIQAYFSKIRLQGFHPKTWRHISMIQVVRPTVSIYRDRNLPSPRGYKPLPSQLLREMDVSFAIDSIRIRQGGVVYEEVAKGKSSPGQIAFSAVNALGKHLTNIPQVGKALALQKEVSPKAFTLTASGKVLGEGRMYASLQVPVFQENNQFELTGKITGLNKHMLNPVLEPLASVRLQSGRFRSINFHFIADEHRARGRLKADYEELKIVLFKQKAKGVQKRRLASFLANQVIIRNKNLLGSKGFHLGTIAVARNKERSLFHYIWGAVKEGIMTSIVKSKGNKKK
ncbi:hypothetical protein AAG747_15970 [Rapidithrix thailandica]|uniref:DUF748 domain-containing protein n=1 Tax=Rapidithrix thailandica TaxID=413964 RepID=A0AAW9SAA7_9BACT